MNDDRTTPQEVPATDARRDLLGAWLGTLAPELGLHPQSLRPASSDASFRRYFRVDAGVPGSALPGSYIAMDAPPPQEDTRPFVRIARLLGSHGLNTPEVIASDLERGFLLLSDLGTTTYADALLRPGTDVAALYDDAIDALVRLQRIVPAAELAGYDEARLLAEMRLFPDWYVARHLGITLDEAERRTLEAAFARLVASARAQTQVLVHRDFHCRNLMVIGPAVTAAAAPIAAARTAASGTVAALDGAARRNPGVLDFQDAVVGPVTYDLVSLLRDAYVEWPEEQQIDWAARYWERARRAGIALPAPFDVFWRDLEWMGLQRSLKVLGIFARLHHRDGKARYLDDLPLVLRHTQRVVERYDAFGALARLLDRVHARPRQSGWTF